MSIYFEKDFVVDSRAVDMFQQSRPSAVLGCLQEAATLASLDLGVSGPQIMEKYNCLWMVSRNWVEMDCPLRWNETFTVRTWHRGASGASVYRDFDIFRDGRPVGQGVSVWVMVEADAHKLFRMKGLEEFRDTDGGELCKSLKLRGLKLPDDFEERELRPMRYSETDINGHINNVHYADFACDALHMEGRDPEKFVRSFQIDYVGECRAGETIAIDTARRDGQWFARGTGPDGDERFDFALTLSD